MIEMLDSGTCVLGDQTVERNQDRDAAKLADGAAKFASAVATAAMETALSYANADSWKMNTGIVLYCIVLYCIVLYCIVFSSYSHGMLIVFSSRFLILRYNISSYSGRNSEGVLSRNEKGFDVQLGCWSCVVENRQNRWQTRICRERCKAYRIVLQSTNQQIRRPRRSASAGDARQQGKQCKVHEP